MRALVLIFLFISSLLWMTLSNYVFASNDLKPISKAVCVRQITDENLNAIIEEVFINKIKKLADEGVIDKEFWNKNKNLGFVVCDNDASYDSFVVYGSVVVFDYQMIAFLFSQSRAFVVGRYISLDDQFIVHEHLLRRFIAQDDSLDSGPMEIIKSKAIELGMKEGDYNDMIENENFKRREQTFMLQSLYFLVMHERCHVALDHDKEIINIKNMDKDAKRNRQNELEYAADLCAIDIINKDESRYKSVPVSFFGTFMTVATQMIISSHPVLSDKSSHPSAGDRLQNALTANLKFLSGVDSDEKIHYEATIRGTKEYYDKILN